MTTETTIQPLRSPEVSTIHKGTLVPLSLAAATFVAAITFHSWLGGRLDKIEDAIKATGHRVERLEERQSNAVTRGQLELWATRLQRDNQDIKVPSVGQ